MYAVLLALRRAARDLTAPRMFTLMFWPMVLALLLWGGLAWGFGATWKTEIAAFLANTPLDSLARWVGAEWLLAYAALFVLILLWLPAVYLTALLITSVAFMPIIVAYVADRDFPRLERRRGGSNWGSLTNSLRALVLYLVGWVLLLPLWLFAPFGVVVSIMLNAWLNQRMFLYDCLSEHADERELDRLRHEGGWPVTLFSAFLGVLHFVPVFNILAPVYMGLAFTHYGLERLRQERGNGTPKGTP
jgi:CysZ protein